MIQERHGCYVPHQGTSRKLKVCPTGALGSSGRSVQTNYVLPNNVAFYRNQADMTQARLGEMIGCHRDYVAKLESGAKPLGPGWLEKIGDALGVEPYLLIAPDGVVPTEDELVQMIADAQSTLPVGLPYSEWPRAVAAGLRTRLRTLAGDRANVGA